MKTVLAVELSDDLNAEFSQTEHPKDRYVVAPNGFVLDIYGEDEMVTLFSVDEIEKLYDFLGKVLYEVR